MIGSCHTISVVMIPINNTGWAPCLRQATTYTVMMIDIEMIVKIWKRSSQLSNPNSGSTGRGAPSTSGLRMRGDTAPLRAFTAIRTRRTTATAIHTAPFHEPFLSCAAGDSGVGVAS